MNYKSLHQCVLDLEKHGHLIRVAEEVDPYLEMAEIHRRVYEKGGPALFFDNVKGSPFPAVSNLFGTMERSRFIFRSTLERIKFLFRVKADISQAFKHPLRTVSLAGILAGAIPRKVHSGPSLAQETSIGQLPQIQCWPEDGGTFVLLPQVYTESPDRPGIWNSNTGMYRIQLSGNDYLQDQEVGLHYQIRRDIGIHHTLAKERGESLKVSVFVGGPPAHTFAAVMFLPENLPEAAFAGALGGRAFRYARKQGHVLSTDADFCITGTVDPHLTKPEGPFGDHLGYYSLKHNFPFLKVAKVYHRKNAIWPFTVVGRPPQEDTSFGKLIQEIAGPMIPLEIPGVKEVHAVDAAGVHPLLLAIGSERYVPYQERKPLELLTQANALLGYGPCSLAKYVWIAAGEDNLKLSTHNVCEFFEHVLERADWSHDLHFQTETSMDTLDYTGGELNRGSKAVVAVAGNPLRTLANQIPELRGMPEGFSHLEIPFPGCLVFSTRAFQSYEKSETEITAFAECLRKQNTLEGFALIILCDDARFSSQSIENFLWTTFTRSDPAKDIYGVASFTTFKHWGCRGPLIIDARIKPHHAPTLEVAPETAAKVDQLALQGKSLHGIF